MRKNGIISLGEVFVDYISTDNTNSNYRTFLGGATVNVAVGMRRLGVPSYYLCKLGLDETSKFVEQELRKEKINTEFCVRSESKKICKVKIHITPEGDRYFHSYMNSTPDEVLTSEELREDLFESGKIFYFGSGTLFHQTAKNTTEIALKYAKESNVIIAFDTNIRLKRWESEEQCRDIVCSFLPKVDIAKLSEDELLFLTETDSIEEGLVKLAKWKIPYVFITMGGNGACAVFSNSKIHVPAEDVEAIDTTGAGDAFMSALLYYFHEKGKPSRIEQIEEYVLFANHAGAIATTKYGSL